MTEAEKPKKNKIPRGSIELHMVGNLLLARCKNRDLAPLFKRYETLLEVFANMARPERLINYRFLLGLILTSHAKKCQNLQERKKIFELKNMIFLNLCNDKEVRRKLAFRYLISKNFRVIKFCLKCNEKNQKENHPKHRWKFCGSCQVDRKFYNVLSMHHKFDSGSATLFLSNDLIEKVENIKLNQRGRISDFTEEARFEKYQYNVRNLDVFDYGTITKIHGKLLSPAK